MATALQVFYNLGTLVSRVNKVVTKVRDNLRSSVQEALDPKTLSQAQPNTGRILSAAIESWLLDMIHNE